ncbi:MAG: hypothetical protein ACK6C0_16370 [Betaproteobacteria bacterium]
MLAAGGTQAQHNATMESELRADGCVKCHDVGREETGPSPTTVAADAKNDDASAGKPIAGTKETPKCKRLSACGVDLKAIVDWMGGL